MALQRTRRESGEFTPAVSLFLISVWVISMTSCFVNRDRVDAAAAIVAAVADVHAVSFYFVWRMGN